MRTKQFLQELMNQAWQFVKCNGVTMQQALIIAWRNAKLRIELAVRIVKFYFQKIDGTIREAYGTLRPNRIPVTAGDDKRKKNDTVQIYFDTEKQEWRCFKKMNLIRF